MHLGAPTRQNSESSTATTTGSLDSSSRSQIMLASVSPTRSADQRAQAEETVSASVTPNPGLSRAHEHPGDPPQPCLRDLANDQARPERLKRRLREARRKEGQQPLQRSGNIHEHRR